MPLAACRAAWAAWAEAWTTSPVASSQSSEEWGGPGENPRPAPFCVPLCVPFTFDNRDRRGLLITLRETRRRHLPLLEWKSGVTRCMRIATVPPCAILGQSASGRFAEPWGRSDTVLRHLLATGPGGCKIAARVVGLVRWDPAPALRAAVAPRKEGICNEPDRSGMRPIWHQLVLCYREEQGYA